MDGERGCVYLPAMRFVLLTGKGKRLPFNYLITSMGIASPARSSSNKNSKNI